MEGCLGEDNEDKVESLSKQEKSNLGRTGSEFNYGREREREREREGWREEGGVTPPRVICERVYTGRPLPPGPAHAAHNRYFILWKQRISAT
jgi:hypothetical protein